MCVITLNGIYQKIYGSLPAAGTVVKLADMIAASNLADKTASHSMQLFCGYVHSEPDPTYTYTCRIDAEGCWTGMVRWDGQSTNVHYSEAPTPNEAYGQCNTATNYNGDSCPYIETI